MTAPKATVWPFTFSLTMELRVAADTGANAARVASPLRYRFLGRTCGWLAVWVSAMWVTKISTVPNAR